MTRMLIDTDTASDDAVALVLALRHPSVVVEAITVVAGNVPLDQAVQNALYTVELCEADVPVFAGRPAPIARPLETAQSVHGADGMGDIGLPLSGRNPAGGHAVEEIIDRIMAAPGEVRLVTLGPLSNIATALLLRPELADAVEHCYVMGGAGRGPGNVTPLAEYNFWADPEAARVVLRSRMPLTLVGWDISVASATVGPAEARRLRALGPLGEFAVDIQAVLDAYAREQSHLDGFDLPDPMAVAVAIDPGMAVSESHHVDVLTVDEARGKDVVDWLDTLETEHRARVVVRADRDRFMTMLASALAG